MKDRAAAILTEARASWSLLGHPYRKSRKYFYFQFQRSGWCRRCCSVIYIGFQIEKVNEYYGEAEAERRLKYAAGELRKGAGNGAVVARVSGGGFGILRPWRGETELKAWMEHMLERLNQYDRICQRDASTRFYGGVYRTSKERRDRSETVLYCARQGYHHAIRENVGYMHFQTTMLKQDRERRELKKRFFKAIEDREFKVVLQPVVDGKTQEIVGAEALSRWEHPLRGRLYPSSYIGVIESERNVADLDFYMFEEVCRLLEQWDRRGRNRSISCNITRITIGQPDFTQRIREIADRYSFDHMNLVIEITEYAMEIGREHAARNISKCKEYGFRIALDDVGSGNTSFLDFKNYPIDIVKIDRSVLESAKKEQGAALLKGMISLAHSLHMEVLCEGVETRQQMEFIRQLGSDYMQGYYFYQAVSVEEANRLLDEGC